MNAHLEHRFRQSLVDHRDAVAQVEALVPEITAAAAALWQVLAGGGRILLCGNGGSAADAQHFAAELTGRFVAERQPLAAIALTTDTSALTAIGNDYGFEWVFARQVAALGRSGDALVAISTSGHSPNVLNAVERANALEMTTVGLLGRDGGALATRVARPLIVGVKATARIQEAHELIFHLWCEAFDTYAESSISAK
ncbi:MAG: SIS domain-containing protein [Candidatus Competibacterales bacterium]